MAKATVTIREVKNKVTGIDLSIPSHRVIPGLLSSTIEYHVVVVTNLPVFKSAKHKETDTVQFVIAKRISDFEDFKWGLQGKFPGLNLPTLPKRDLIGDSAVQGKLVLLEKFLNVIATTGKLATHHVTLQFLGVNPYKAGKFRAEESSGEKPSQQPDNRYDIFDNGNSSGETNKPPPDDLFGDEDKAEAETDDLFDAPMRKNVTESSQDDSLFSSDNLNSKPTDPTKLFEAPDLGGAINDDEEDLFLVPGSKTEKTDLALRRRLDEEDNSDLLNIEDDFDKFLKVGPKLTEKEKTSKPVISEKPAIKEKPKNLPPKPGVKPKPGAKPNIAPKPGQKPAVPSKPKPPAKQKPKPKLVDDDEFNKGNLFSEENETDIFGTGTEGKMVKDVSDVDLFSITTDTSGRADDVDADDILKYIQANTDKKEEDLDLFS